MEWIELLYVGGEPASESWVSRLDPRLKIGFVALSILLILMSTGVSVPLYFLVLSGAFILAAGVRFTQFVLRLVAPFFVIGTLLIVQLFFYGQTPLWSWDIGMGTLIVYREGLTHGLELAARVAGGVSLIIVLSLTSSVLELLAALKFYFVPEAWLEIAFLSYRYLFVFLKHLITGYQSQKLRMGYRGISNSFRSGGSLMGNLFLRVMDQTQKTYVSMRMRGYRERIPIPAIRHVAGWSQWGGALMLLLPPGVLLWL